VINHPAVTCAIIGPRIMERLESQLPAADVTLTADVLDRIDELVAPGAMINPDDNNYGQAECSRLRPADATLNTDPGACPPESTTSLPWSRRRLPIGASPDSPQSRRSRGG
jgi:hypothetical protein